MATRIIPYDSIYNDKIMKLEQSVVQGIGIQLLMIKKHFLSRAMVFKKNEACLALDSNDQLLGVSVGAQTTMIVNGESFEAGIGIDLKVDPAQRNLGIGRMLTQNTHQKFLIPQGLKRNFITLKKSNMAVLKLTSRAATSTWLYDFTYLTIPTTSRILKTRIAKDGEQLFKVSLFQNDPVDPTYYKDLHNGLGYFYTHLMYQLSVRKISHLVKLGFWILRKLNPHKYLFLPKEKDIVGFATLYNHTTQNIGHINEVLAQLELQGVRFLMVCCRKNDPVYTFLKTLAIHQQGYLILSDFPLHRNDELTIDVRCL